MKLYRITEIAVANALFRRTIHYSIFRRYKYTMDHEL